MKFYYVESPVWEGFGAGEAYMDADCVYVEAKNKRDAVIIGVKLMEGWMDHVRKNNENPFAGVKVKEVSKEEVDEYIYCVEQPW
jgi:hypothetical protein